MMNPHATDSYRIRNTRPGYGVAVRKCVDGTEIDETIELPIKDAKQHIKSDLKIVNAVRNQVDLNQKKLRDDNLRRVFGFDASTKSAESSFEETRRIVLESVSNAATEIGRSAAEACRCGECPMCFAWGISNDQ